MTTAVCSIVMYHGSPCGRPIHARGMCDGHVQRMSAGRDQEGLGAPWQWQPRCDWRGRDGKACTTVVDCSGDRCAAHAASSRRQAADDGWRPGQRRQMRVIEDVARFDREIDEFVRNHHRSPTTNRTYAHAWRKFTRWARRAGVPFEPPVDPIVAIAYLTALAEPSLDPAFDRTAAFSTSEMNSAANAIRAAHVDAGLGSPTDHPLFKAVLRGARQVARAETRQAKGLAVSASQMRLMVHAPPVSASTAWRVALLQVVAAAEVSPQAASRAGPAIGRSDGSAVVMLGDRRVLVEPTDASWLSPAEAFGALPQAGGQAFAWRACDGRADRLARQRADRTWARVEALFPGIAVHDLRDPILLRQVVARCDQTRLQWLRDRALLLVGWHLGRRFDDLRLLRLGVELRREDRGWLVHLPRTKTDQLRRGRWLTLVPLADLCPVVALDDWVELSGIADGDLVFSSLKSPGRGKRALATKDVAALLAGALRRAGHSSDGYASRALRYGFIVEALAQGHSASAVADVTGHSTLEMVYGYARSELARRSARQRAEKLVV